MSVYDVMSFGEVLVDWVSTAPARSLDAARGFEKAPGGAPANVAVALARLGTKVAFAGGMSPDAFGRWLRSELRRDGVDVGYAPEIEGTQTRMAYVLKTDSGDRKLAAFTTVGVADAAFDASRAEALPYADAAMVHCGSVTLASSPSDQATAVVVRRAREAGAILSVDPNLRLALWRSSEAALSAIVPLVSAADVLKVNDEEATFLTGDSEPERAALVLWERYRPAVLAVTLGAKGAILRSASGTVRHAGFRVEAVDATGAGDAFVAGVLADVAGVVRGEAAPNRRARLDALTADALAETLRRACALGALATTRVGAMAGLPTKSELDAFLG